MRPTPYSFVPASVRHIRAMSEGMRAAGAAALEGYGFNPREALRRVYIASHHCRTALSDGKPIAMWGVAGTLLNDAAYVWLVLAEEAQRMPRALLIEARAELAQVMQRYPEISATVLPHDEASIRFALHLGFRGDDDEDDILTDAKYRLPMGDGYAIRLTYRPDAPRPVLRAMVH